MVRFVVQKDNKPDQFFCRRDNFHVSQERVILLQTERETAVWRLYHTIYNRDVIHYGRKKKRI